MSESDPLPKSSRASAFVVIALLFVAIIVVPPVLADRLPLGTGSFFLDVGIWTSLIVSGIGLAARGLVGRKRT